MYSSNLLLIESISHLSYPIRLSCSLRTSHKAEPSLSSVRAKGCVRVRRQVPNISKQFTPSSLSPLSTALREGRRSADVIMMKSARGKSWRILRGRLRVGFYGRFEGNDVRLARAHTHFHSHFHSHSFSHTHTHIHTHSHTLTLTLICTSPHSQTL